MIRAPGWLPLRLSTLGALLVVVSGCTYLHNPTNAKRAHDTAAEFQKIQTSSVGLYAQMLENHQKVERKNADLQAGLARTSATAFAAAVAVETWKDIQGNLAQRQPDAKRVAALDTEVAKLVEEQTGKAAEAKEFEGKLAEARTALKRVFDQQQQWEARQLLFRGAIKFLATIPGDASVSAERVQAFKKEVLDTKVKTEEMASDGTITLKDSTVGDLLKTDRKDLEELKFESVLKKYAYDLFDTEKAPGIRVQIFSLGIDLAKAQYERARLETAYLKSRIEVLEQRREMARAQSLAIALTILRDRQKDNSLPPAETPLATMERLRASWNRATDGKQRRDIDLELQDAFKVLAIYGVVEALDESARLALESRPAILAHEYSIQLSAVNAREREAVIARGLEGLVTYHDGGLTPETIANFLRAVTAAGVLVIGAGTW